METIETNNQQERVEALLAVSDLIFKKLAEGRGQPPYLEALRRGKEIVEGLINEIEPGTF